MPYIPTDNREVLDPIINSLHQAIVGLEMDNENTNTEGDINYIVTRLIMMVYGDKDSTTYSNINDVMGILECVKHEYYRKVATPYETQKESEAGAVQRFPHSEPEIVGSIDIIMSSSTDK